MPKTGKKRDKKLFNDELCHVCKTRPAKGFKEQADFCQIIKQLKDDLDNCYKDKRMTSLKYNAISCDACRVFFRRVVKDSDSAVDYQLPDCKCGDVCNPLCQSCRFGKCLNAGMKREYVSGTSFYQDQRTIASVDSQFGLTYVIFTGIQ